jgi:hypothetical protein
VNSYYRFSSIKTGKDLDKVYEYIAGELGQLAVKVLGEKLPITTLKVFPHYPEEYQFLHKIISKMGEPAEFNSKTSFYVKVNKKIKGYDIDYLGIRIVDPYRLQVGCGDFEVSNLDLWAKKLIGKNEYIRWLTHVENMIEIWHPDFDVLGYIVAKEIN